MPGHDMVPNIYSYKRNGGVLAGLSMRRFQLEPSIRRNPLNWYYSGMGPNHFGGATFVIQTNKPPQLDWKTPKTSYQD